ncbi:hypothetical protein IWW34DRAFT_345795 [Fusarium oxysporum f. sp. albedinis]|nr:hypothetical protein IWW34DRAFT_345795 [Fusarium oxysporum f. sp. albedinis]
MQPPPSRNVDTRILIQPSFVMHSGPSRVFQVYVPATDNARFNEIEEHYKRNGRYCGICGTWKLNLNSHIIDQHSGSKHAVIYNGEATRDKTKSLLQRRRDRRSKETFPPKLLALVRQMKNSLPPLVRHFGGRFEKGPLQGQEVTGLPQFFEKSSGRLKSCYMDLVQGTEVHPQTRSKARRACNIPPAGSFRNKLWIGGSGLSVVTMVSTNVWTPDKYPDWTGPPGFLAGEDPTWIPCDLPQCAFCTRSVCDCIREKVRREVPRIREAPNMGEGVWATSDYEKGEFLGELVGELAPIDYHTDGWAADLSRNDLSPKGDDVAWCQVYTRYMGNWVRKVNHSCEPNCAFVSFNISGRWRLMLQASRQIKRNSWILADYGQDYWTDGRRCLCGSDQCISRLGADVARHPQ